jgi:hypothetical protein
MRLRVLILIALVLVVLLLPTNITWWKRDRPPADSAAAVEAPPPPPPFLLGAGGRPITFTLDSLPAEVMAAVKARYPEFVPHNPKEMPQASRAAYRPSADEGLIVVRGNLASSAPAYALVGMQGTSQMVVGVVKDPNAGLGWSARSMSSTGSPPFDPWVIVSRRRRGHPNGRLDAIVVRILDPKGEYDDVYAWNPTEKRFNLGGGAR